MILLVNSNLKRHFLKEKDLQILCNINSDMDIDLSSNDNKTIINVSQTYYISDVSQTLCNNKQVSICTT